MNVEKRMEFIRKTLADIGVKQAQTDRRMYELQAMAKAGLRQIAAFGTIPRKELAALYRELAASRKETERAMREWQLRKSAPAKRSKVGSIADTGQSALVGIAATSVVVTLGNGRRKDDGVHPRESCRRRRHSG